ncbi:hypothetical protein [Streptacidiphilus carbonis]|uniref:hypothetical protein n=1 Tax=Streptacidiphilus carbonis TaxID=105422 RepID=UPI000A81873D|nr:hypothetical protein [Streptacidiphilus carbonis]
MLADILTEAVTAQWDAEPAEQAALRVAGCRGEAAGAAERDRVRPGRLGPERGLTVAAAGLEPYGFEPQRTAPTLVRLLNCPFHALAVKAPELVCGINHAFLTGYLRGLGSDTTTAVLAPRPGVCCVELRALKPGDSPSAGDSGCGR